jgi:hypothetical protein
MRGLILVFVVAVASALVASTAVAGTTSWQENFESAACGALPNGWASGLGNDDLGAVWDVGSIVCQGEKALGFYGIVGGCWAALAVVPVSQADGLYASHFTLEFTVRGGTEPTSGCHGGARAHVELNAATDWTGDHRGIFYLGQNGELSGTGITFGQVDLETCHRIGIDYTRVDATTVHVEYTLDGNPAGATSVTCGPVEDTLRYLHFGALEGSAWYDDIAVTATTGGLGVQSDTWGRLKGDFHD